jgi:carbon storage regulator
MLILSRKKEESIMIGDAIEVSVVDIKGDQVKIGITAPRDIKVYRREVFTAIQKENLAASKTGTQLPNIDMFKNSALNSKSATVKVTQALEKQDTPAEVNTEKKEPLDTPGNPNKT